MKVYTRMREIELKSSRLLGLLWAGMALLALFAIGLAALPDSVQWVLAAGMASLFGWKWRQALPLPRLRIATDGALQMLGEADAWCDIDVLGDSFVATGLIVLRYRLEGRKGPSLMLLPDSAAADDLRRIRMSLRWTRRTRSDTSSPDAG